MTSSAHWAGSGKMKSGQQTSIELLMSKVGSTWCPVSPTQPHAGGDSWVLGFLPWALASLSYFIWGTSWISPPFRLPDYLRVSATPKSVNVPQRESEPLEGWELVGQ